jgi:uncharacterized ParB-like nuclease family protein
MAQNIGLEREYLKIMNCETIQAFNNSYIYDHVRVQSLDGKVECKVAFCVPTACNIKKETFVSSEQIPRRVISGFRRGINKNFNLLGCYATSIRTKSPTFRGNLSVPPTKVRQFECFTLEDGTDRLSRNVGNLPPINAPLTSYKSEDLTYYNFGSAHKNTSHVSVSQRPPVNAVHFAATTSVVTLF